ncbi:MAG: hypothetical protein Q7J32_18940 [Sphingomonadaceae bacterium]|nr:hypothetical protein [Sphingomonadaceae bacterium]
MKWLLILLAMPTAAVAQTVPQVPTIDAARAAARAVDQSVQAPRTGQESMDRTAPLLTVEPHKDPAAAEADEAAWRKAREAEAKKKLEKPEPKRD